MDRITKSVFTNVRSYVNKKKEKYILSKYGLKKCEDMPIHFIYMVETLKAYNITFDSLIDIGAFKGWFTLVMNSLIKIDKSICIEPNKKYIQDIIEINNKYNVNVVNVALSDCPGEVTYKDHPEHPQMNSIVEINKSLMSEKFQFCDVDLFTESKVDVKTLDQITDDKIFGNPPEHNYFIKIDTQGNELNILKAGQKVLERTNGILIEYMFTNPYYANYSFNDLVDYLYISNFVCKGALNIERASSHEISAVDFLFIKNKEK
jgi:FkbM family methyltransferase